MGSISDLAGMIPGMDTKALAGATVDEKALTRTAAIIQSMTPKERDNPELLNSSRKKRIAAGSGTQVVDVNRLLKQFEMMQTMAKQMGGKKMRMPFKGKNKGKRGLFGF
jgi:signal recognition particle subunit SRP54